MLQNLQEYNSFVIFSISKGKSVIVANFFYIIAVLEKTKVFSYTGLRLGFLICKSTPGGDHHVPIPFIRDILKVFYAIYIVSAEERPI